MSIKLSIASLLNKNLQNLWVLVKMGSLDFRPEWATSSGNIRSKIDEANARNVMVGGVM